MTFWNILEFSKKAKIICEECNKDLEYSIIGSMSHEGEKLQINIEKHCDKMKEHEELVEKVADFMHDQWSHWMKYLFSKTDYGVSWTGEMILGEDVKRWKRQMETPYAELSEKEKDSDREWARKLLEVIK